MTASIERQGGGLICHDRDALAEVGEILLYDDSIDLVVVEGLVRSRLLIDSLQNIYDENGVTKKLYEHAAVLTQLDQTVASYWTSQGYKDYVLVTPGLIPGDSTTGSASVHSDFGSENIARIVGPLTVSIGTAGWAAYWAQKPQATFLTNERDFDKRAWKTWKHQPAPTTLRSHVVQQTGDAVLFMNHPRQTYHSVTAGQETRKATTFDYMARKKLPTFAEVLSARY